MDPLVVFKALFWYGLSIDTKVSYAIITEHFANFELLII